MARRESKGGSKKGAPKKGGSKKQSTILADPADVDAAVLARVRSIVPSTRSQLPWYRLLTPAQFKALELIRKEVADGTLKATPKQILAEIKGPWKIAINHDTLRRYLKDGPTGEA